MFCSMMCPMKNSRPNLCLRLRLGRSSASTHASRLRFNQSQARTYRTVREGIHLPLTNRRSLSESVNASFVVIQHHHHSPRLCSRSYSTSPPSASSPASTSESTPSATASEPSQEQIDEECELYSFLTDFKGIDPDMLVLKPDIQSLPPLPPIQNDAIRRQVFTHRSVYGRARHDFEDHPHDPAPDFEVLEFQGDAVLGLIITDLVRECYPNLRVGPATKIKSLVVANANIADISIKYGLPQKLRVHRSNNVALKASINIQADVFEAYIGGLYKDQGLDVARKWINALLLPYVKEAYRVCRDQHGLPSPPPSPSLEHAQDVLSDTDPNPASNTTPTPTPNLSCPQNHNNPPGGHLSLFNQYLQQKHMRLEWEFDAIKDEGTKVTPIWAVHAIVDGHQLAVGRGNTKKAAQNEAAREGLVQLGVSNPLE